jgi:DNA polymerase III alpha subunit
MAHVIEGARTISLGDDEGMVDGRAGWFAGILTSVTRVLTRNGKQMIDFTIEDLDGFREGRLFGNVYARFEPLFVEDAVLRIRGKVEVTDRGTKLQVMDVMPLTDDGSFSRRPDAVQVEVTAGGGTKTYRLPPETYHVDKTSHRLHSELREVFGTDAVHER